MKTALVHLSSATPYSQARSYSEEVPKLPKELADDYEKRTWRNRSHVDSKGNVFIPGTAFANAIKQAVKRLKIQVPGKGRVEFTKYFEAGVMVQDNLNLNVKGDDVPFDRLFVPSDGRRGGPKRVWKTFPRIDSWSGDVLYYIFDDIITQDVFTQAVVASGMLVGIGRFRPESCGYYGRFSVDSIQWNENADDMFGKVGAAE